MEESHSQCLITASEQLKQHLNSNYGFSNLDEYNSHILPPRKSLEINQHNIIPPEGIIIFIVIYILILFLNLKFSDCVL